MAQTHTTEHPNTKIVERMYECFGSGDMQALQTDVFAPGIVWHLPGRHPLSGDKKGPDEVIAFFGQLIKSNIKIDLISVTGTDEYVVEIHRGYTENLQPALDALNCTVYYIREGKISEVQVFISNQHLVDTFFWAHYQLKPIPDRLA